MAKLNRIDVYNILDTEREYQISQAKSPERPDMIPVLSVGETLSAIRHILAQADEAWYYGNGDHPEAMEFLRKIGGLVVQAGENHGMPPRKGW